MFFLLKARLQNFIAANKKPATLLVNSIILLAYAVNVVIAIYTINYFYDNKENTALYDVFRGLDLLILILFIAQVFIPVYKPRAVIFSRADPMNEFSQTAVELIYNLISPFFILVIFSLLIFFLFAKAFTVSQFMKASGITIFSGILSILIQSFFTQSLKGKILLFIYTGTVVSAIYFSITSTRYNIVISASILLSAFAFHITRLKEIVIAEAPVKVIRERESYNRLLYKICTKTKAFRLNIILAVVFKTIFLLLLSMKPSVTKTFASEFFKWFIISPLIYFTYVFNNLWGYLPATYRLFGQRRNVPYLYANYTRVCGTVLLADMVITFSLLAYFKYSAFSNIYSALFFYAASAVFLIYIGFYSSVKNPFEIKRFLDFASFKTNTPLQYNFISMLIVVFAGYVIGTAYGAYILWSMLFMLLCIYYRQIIRGELAGGKKNIFNRL